MVAVAYDDGNAVREFAEADASQVYASDGSCEASD